MRILIFQIILFISLKFAAEESYVLMISFDGFRYDYMNFLDTPNLDYFEKMGVKADGLIAVFPSLTFPNHYSIATGSYADKHNITGNSFYDKSLKKKYSLYDRDAVQDPQFYKAEPIWITAEKQGIKSASFFWVGTEAPIKGISPSIFKYYNGDIPFKTRIDSVISWFSLKKNKRPQLILLYFSEPDQTGHEYGVQREKIIESVSKMDNLLGYLHDRLKTLNIYSQLNIIITSDHGMTDVSSDRLIILDNYISRIESLYISGRGSHVQFDMKKNMIGYTEKLFKELKKIPNAQVWKKSEIPDRFHFVNANTGDYLLLADEGWFISTNNDLKERGLSINGMHGYDPQLINMHGIFYAMGPGINPGLQIKSFENIHVYPLVCKLLDIEADSDIIDAIDGDFNVVKHILKKNR